MRTYKIFTLNEKGKDKMHSNEVRNVNNWTDINLIGKEIENIGNDKSTETVIAKLLYHIAIELNSINEHINERKEHNVAT